MYQAVLFDFDGTLFDTWAAIYEALRLTAENSGIEIESSESYLLKEYGDLGRLPLMTNSFNRTPIEQELEFFVATYTNILIDKTKPFTNTINIINYLSESSIKWGIVTNKPKQYLQIFIKELFYLKSCSVIICPEDVAKRKPDPEPLLKACQQMGIELKDTLFIGDSLNDSKAASSCNMDFAFAEYGYTKLTPDLKYNYILKDIIEVKDILNAKI